jgi:zinc protease
MSIDRSRPPEPAAIRTFQFPQVRSEVLSGGITLLSARHGDLPIVTVRAVIDAGAAVERPGEEGLAWLTAHALLGGTAQHTGDALAWELEKLGAQVEPWTTWDSLNVELTTRADRMADAMLLLAEIVRTPAFPRHEVERLRNEQLAEILRRSTEPRGLADDAAARCIFAENATYGRPLVGSARVVRHLGRDAAEALHRRRFTPHGTAIVVVGDVDPDHVRREVERAFGDWTGAPADAPATLTTPRVDRTTVFLVDRPSAVQSELRIGHVGVPRHHPDYYALLVLNTLLGGAFTSRLNMSLREKHGFTYGVRSGFAFRRAAGPFIIQTAVASDVTARAVEETLRVLRDVHDNGVTDEEVRAARDYIAGTLPLEMQTTEHLAARIADLHTFALPTDYFESYREQIGAVTATHVVEAARTHLQLDRLSIVVVGSAADIRDELAGLGYDIVPHDVTRDESLSSH